MESSRIRPRPMSTLSKPPTRRRICSSTRSATARPCKTLPITAAGSTTLRSSLSNWSRRVARRARMVGGSSMRSISPTGPPLPISASQVPLINEHGQQLLDEERVAFGRLHDTTADVTRKGILQQILDQRICVALGERLQPNNAAALIGRRPSRRLVIGVRTHKVEKQQRDLVGAVLDLRQKV